MSSAATVARQLVDATSRRDQVAMRARIAPDVPFEVLGTGKLEGVDAVIGELAATVLVDERVIDGRITKVAQAADLAPMITRLMETMNIG